MCFQTQCNFTTEMFPCPPCSLISDTLLRRCPICVVCDGGRGTSVVSGHIWSSFVMLSNAFSLEVIISVV